MSSDDRTNVASSRSGGRPIVGAVIRNEQHRDVRRDLGSGKQEQPTCSDRLLRAGDPPKADDVQSRFGPRRHRRSGCRIEDPVLTICPLHLFRREGLGKREMKIADPFGSAMQSGRPGSNRRRPAWEAGILPLNYARVSTSNIPRETKRINGLIPGDSVASDECCA